jgi:hypothetical protein
MEGGQVQELLGALIEGRPVYVQERGGTETIVYSLEMRGSEAVGFRAKEGDRLIKFDEIQSVSLAPSQNHTVPFEALLLRASHIPSDSGDVALQFRGGELHQITNPLPFGTELPEGALVEIGFARLPPTLEAQDGYQLAYYRLAEAHAGAVPFPYYVYAADGKYYWQIFIADDEALREFRDAFTPDCRIEGL